MKRHVSTCVAAGVTFWTAVAAALPPDRVIHFAVHEDPDDAASRIQYVLTLSLSAHQQSGAFVGWSIDLLQITEYTVAGGGTVWSVHTPAVATTDGLWWVEHVTPEAPMRSDFVEPAPVNDTALAADPSDPDMHFDVVGVPYAPPSGGPPYAVTAALDFAFTKDGSSGPDDRGDGEPVDVPDWGNDPSIGVE